jgi:hypothetical protein
MKTLELEQFGVQEMDAVEVFESNGGNQPAASYLTSEQIAAVGEAKRTIGSFIGGFIAGLFDI